MRSSSQQRCHVGWQHSFSPGATAQTIMPISSTPLAHALVATPDLPITNLREATNFLATMTAAKRAQPHWHRAVRMLAIAAKEPRYITVATLNLQTALTLDRRLQSAALGHPEGAL